MNAIEDNVWSRGFRELGLLLPRPRAIEIKKTPEYLTYRNQVWDLLRDEVLRARAEHA